MEFYSAVNKEKNVNFCSNGEKNLKRIVLNNKKKVDVQDYILPDCSHIKFQKRNNYGDKRAFNNCLGSWKYLTL